MAGNKEDNDKSGNLQRGEEIRWNRRWWKWYKKGERGEVQVPW